MTCQINDHTDKMQRENEDDDESEETKALKKDPTLPVSTT